MLGGSACEQNGENMTELIEYSLVRVVQMFRPSNEYDDWGVNQRDPQIGDTGTFIDILHAPGLPDKYVVENSGDDGIPIWLSDFFADEIQVVEPPNLSLNKT